MSQANLFWFDNVEIRPAPWTGLNWLTSILAVPDVRKTRDLYISVFNFVSIFDLPDPENSEKYITTRLRYRGTNFLLTSEGLDSEIKAPATTHTAPAHLYYVYVDDVDSTYKRALESGMNSLLSPGETFWGDYRARVTCPNGFIWDIAKRL
ncbi:MAG: VOC family protein [Verrucomicrobia bacterium]|nr:VOC family protein [Verrucomicrobiota bacterium]